MPKLYLASVLVFSTLIGCTFQSGDRIINTTAPSSPNLTVTNQNNAQDPAFKTAVISVEGEKTQIPLQVYDAGVLTTYYPAQDFVAESVASGEGTSARFYANFGGTKNEAAYVQIFLPNDTTTIKQLKQAWLEGDRGLFATNRWQVVNSTPDTSYPWVQEKIVFTQAENNITGVVYLGEQGKAFYVVMHYPAEYGDGFAPRADLILQNLEIK